MNETNNPQTNTETKTVAATHSAQIAPHASVVNAEAPLGLLGRPRQILRADAEELGLLVCKDGGARIQPVQ